MKQIILPRKVIKSKNVVNVSALKIKRELQVVLRTDVAWKEEMAHILGKGFIVLDFGKEMHGGIRIVTSFMNVATAKIRIRFGESLSEANAELGEKNTTNNHSPRDFVATISQLSDLTFGQSGFRFARIDFLDETDIFIQNIVCVNQILSKKPLYTYKGNDKRIKQIFTVAKRTLDLCASTDYVWDGIKRDRLVWIGDMHPETIALVTLYGKLDVIERSLNFVRKQTPLPEWMNTFPSYSLWWMIIVSDYYKMTGNKAFILEQVDYLKGLTKQIDGCVSESGEMDALGKFVDWPTCDSNDGSAGVRAICIMALNRVIELFSALGEDCSFAVKALNKVKKVPIVVERMKQVIALKYFAEGTLSDSDYARLIEGGARGLSTFMSYYILKAIASKDPKKAIEIMKDFYGAMLDKGATTFWEDFHTDWIEGSSRIDKMPKKGEKDIHGDYGAHCYVGFRHSLCHGWSSGVIKFIKEYCE